MKELQTSETLKIGILLALSGGFMDAYSYLCRGEVFANAQTGNMLLFGVHLSSGEWQEALRYAFPVLAFAAGIAIDGSHYPRSGGVDSPEPESSCQCTDFVCLWDAGRELS